MARARAEIYRGTTTSRPLVITELVAVAIGWLGFAIHRAASTDGERIAGNVVMGVSLFVAYLGGAVRHAVRVAPTRGDRETRG